MGPKDKPPQNTRSTETTFPTVIGRGLSIRGELVSEEPVEVLGRLEGDALVAAPLRVRQGGTVIGAIEARTLAVEGTVHSPKVVTGTLEVAPSGRIEARVQAQVLTVAEGGCLNGQLEMPGGTTDD